MRTKENNPWLADKEALVSQITTKICVWKLNLLAIFNYWGQNNLIFCFSNSLNSDFRKLEKKIHPGENGK